MIYNFCEEPKLQKCNPTTKRNQESKVQDRDLPRIIQEHKSQEPGFKESRTKILECKVQENKWNPRKEWRFKDEFEQETKIK